MKDPTNREYQPLVELSQQFAATEVRLQANSSIGRAAVSKTAGCGFESLLACQHHISSRLSALSPRAHHPPPVGRVGLRAESQQLRAVSRKPWKTTATRS